LAVDRPVDLQANLVCVLPYRLYFLGAIKRGIWLGF